MARRMKAWETSGVDLVIGDCTRRSVFPSSRPSASPTSLRKSWPQRGSGNLQPVNGLAAQEWDDRAEKICPVGRRQMPMGHPADESVQPIDSVDEMRLLGFVRVDGFPLRRDRRASYAGRRCGRVRSCDLPIARVRSCKTDRCADLGSFVHRPAVGPPVEAG